MSDHDDNSPATRRRLLQTAFHVDEAHSMESRLAWQRARRAAAEYDVTVVCALAESAPEGVALVRLPLSWLERALMRNTATYYVGYRLWHRRVLRLARRLHAERPFDLVHHVSYCGYREPSDCWRLGVPFVLGPIGGTRPFPAAFLGQLDLRGAARELMRNVVNAAQLRFGTRVRRAMTTAAAVLAANREVARDVTRHFGVAPSIQLETGIEHVRGAPRPQRDPRAPLKILWAGRLRSWKALPLLLQALAKLPQECAYELRVMGQGNCRRRWERLARRLGVAERIHWVGWPTYRDQLPHYEWADVFAFTSLRDTSGTGLLEALAAGTPIIGLDHHGAADVMTPDCAIAVPVARPAETIRALAEAIGELAGDEVRRSALSEGARSRARQFTWELQGREMLRTYQAALANTTAWAAVASVHRAPAGERRADVSMPGFLTPQEVH